MHAHTHIKPTPSHLYSIGGTNNPGNIKHMCIIQPIISPATKHDELCRLDVKGPCRILKTCVYAKSMERQGEIACHVSMHTHAHTHVHAHAITQAIAHAQQYTHKHPCTLSRIHPYIHLYIHVHVNMQIRIHTQICALALCGLYECMYKHKQTHSLSSSPHTPPPPPPSPLSLFLPRMYDLTSRRCFAQDKLGRAHPGHRATIQHIYFITERPFRP
jgi:hypothetical protein